MRQCRSIIVKKEILLMKENINIELLKNLKKVVWDYDLNEDQLKEIYFNNSPNYSISKEQLEVKLLNGFSWHHLLKVMGDNAFDLLKDDIINNIFPKSYRNELLNAKKILYG